jgi:hypothetical protein
VAGHRVSASRRGATVARVGRGAARRNEPRGPYSGWARRACPWWAKNRDRRRACNASPLFSGTPIRRRYASLPRYRGTNSVLSWPLDRIPAGHGSGRCDASPPGARQSAARRPRTVAGMTLVPYWANWPEVRVEGAFEARYPHQSGKARKCAGVSDRLGSCTPRSGDSILERSLDTAGRPLYHNCVLLAVRSKGSHTCTFV